MNSVQRQRTGVSRSRPNWLTPSVTSAARIAKRVAEELKTPDEAVAEPPSGTGGWGKPSGPCSGACVAASPSCALGVDGRAEAVYVQPCWLGGMAVPRL